MSWREKPVVSLDFETTGTSFDVDRIITGALVSWEPGVVPVTRQWLADPGRPSSASARNKHGIGDDFARKNGRELAEVLDELCADLAGRLGWGATLIGHCVSFDLTMLDRNCRFLGVPTLGARLGGDDKVRPVIDTLVLTRHYDTRMTSHALGVMAGLYEVKVDGKLHDAATDAMTAMRLAWKIAGRRPEVDIDAGRLHDMQAGWFKPQLVMQVAKYGADVDPEMRWPFKPVLVQRQPQQQQGFQPRLAAPTVAAGDEKAAVDMFIAAGFQMSKIGSTEKVA